MLPPYSGSGRSGAWRQEKILLLLSLRVLHPLQACKEAGAVPKDEKGACWEGKERRHCPTLQSQLLLLSRRLVARKAILKSVNKRAQRQCIFGDSKGLAIDRPCRLCFVTSSPGCLEVPVSQPVL